MSAAPPGLSGSLGLGGGAYPTLCVRCHRMVLLPAEDAVLAEARAVVGDLTVVFCGDCIRQAALRMADDG